MPIFVVVYPSNVREYIVGGVYEASDKELLIKELCIRTGNDREYFDNLDIIVHETEIEKI